MLKKSKSDPESELPLYLRIIKDRESALISLGISVRAEHWNAQKQLIKKSKDTPLAQKWNEVLMRKREEVRLRIFELEEQNPGIRAKEIKDILSRPEGKSFLDQVRSESQKALQGREISRWERIDLLEKHLSVFRNSKDIMVEEIDPEFLRSFRQYLIGLEHNDWKARSIVATMREVYQSAVEVDDTLRVEADPFEGLEMECDFLEYIRDRMKRLLESGQFRTFGRHQSLVKHLEDFLRFIDQDELSFDGITARFLRQFENHLSKVPLKVNSRHTYLKTLRTCLYEAIQDGLFPQELNPFFKFKLKKEKVRKPKLNLEQISQIEALELKPNTGLWNTKNAFLFMFYCAGMRVGDLIQLRWMHVHKDRLRYMMEKTKKAHGPKLIEPAMKILELYRNPLSLPADFIFPLLQNDVDYSDVVFLKKQVSSKTSKLNEHLKTIGGIIGLDFPLTNHIARHSFTRTVQSQDAKEMGIGVHDIQGALAHSSVSITENYLEELDDDALDHVMDGFQEILRRRAIKESDE